MSSVEFDIERFILKSGIQGTVSGQSLEQICSFENLDDDDDDDGGGGGEIDRAWKSIRENMKPSARESLGY